MTSTSEEGPSMIAAAGVHAEQIAACRGSKPSAADWPADRPVSPSWAAAAGS